VLYPVLQLHASQMGSITMRGYLYKHRPTSQLLGLFSQVGQQLSLSPDDSRSTPQNRP
jgi:hypothetical protein